jgi:signal transduction histidine kinase
VLSSLLITSTIAIVAFSTAMTHEIINHIKDTTSFLNSFVVSSATQRFENFEVRVDSQYLENSINFTDNNISLGDKNNINFMLNQLNNELHKAFSSLAVYNLKGIKLASLNNSNNWFDLGHNISNENIIKNSIHGNAFQDKHLWHSPISKDYFVLISTPLYSSLVTNNNSNITSNKIVGVVVASYPVSTLFEGKIIQNVNRDTILYLLSNNGTVVYTSFNNPSKTNPLLSTSSNSIIGSKFNDQPIYSQIKDSSKLVESGIYHHNNSDSRNALFVAAKEPTDNKVINYNQADRNEDNLLNNLILVSELDAGIAFKDMFNLRNAFVISTIVILIGVSIVALLASRSISRPLIKLKDSALSIANGNLNHIIKPISADEVGELATQFEKMRQSVKQHIDSILKKDQEIEKANRELIEIEYKKDEFISMITHELRTPLIPIKGYAEMLLKPKILGEINENQRKAIQSIYRNIKKEEALVEDILDVYKLELGKINLSKREVIISDLFTNVINDLKLMAEEKQISLVSEINTKSGDKVYCDEERIEQVLSNLIKNSIDFVPKKEGKIILRVDEDNQVMDINNNEMVSNLVFTVEDNGKGIPDDKIDSLFNKFYQMDSSATRKHSGTGLGLVICKGIIEAHGGKIWINKDSKVGTTVKFTLQKSKD